ncbi:amidase [Planococcus lenghuensis]|uniref:Amidase n=1 Tax=Planococcus lenghuensis TaxID=2213202 RepID=A0A1Q2KW60_9BACL|nr:amidase [Planococcus lenghuensis]AQQ52354.1 amidase [Planococcus lenghuensis]
MEKAVEAKLQVLDLDATELARRISRQDVSSREATEQYIQQLKIVNPLVNCLVEDRFEQARKEAAEADRQLAAGKASGKLFGVPMSMKEALGVSGMQTTGGLLRRKGFVQHDDAEVVRKLRAEGAILLGKTNTPELCFCQETDNKLYGRTNNPRDLTRTVGGSSGGEAALIAAGGAAAGIGSDIGGSIRFPSHFNGVVGFKPGRGQVSAAGSYPSVDHELQRRMLGIGPITKTVRDARLLYNIIAEKPAEEKSLDDFIIDVLSDTGYPLSGDTAGLLECIYKTVSKDFQTAHAVPPFFRQSALLWQEIMSIEGAKGAGQEAFGEQPIRPHLAYITERITGKADIHRYLSWALIGAALFKPSEKRLSEIRESLKRGDDELDHYLKGRVLIFPVYHTGAPKHGVVYKEIFSIRKTFQSYMPFIAYANTWGLPSLTVPVGRDENHMPIGVQLISRNGNEEALFQLGEWLEEQFGGYERAKTEEIAGH